MASVEKNPSSCCSAAKNPNSGGSAVETPMPQRCRQVSEFKDTFGTFSSYRRKWQIELNPNFNHFDCCDLDSDGEAEEARNFPNFRETLITHIQQVRHSFGFDVECKVPYWAGISYFPIDLSEPRCLAESTEVAKVAINGINAYMNRKIYELVEVVKAVYCRDFSTYVTFTAKKVDADDDEVNSNSVVAIQAIVFDYPGGRLELEQWRFKR